MHLHQSFYQGLCINMGLVITSHWNGYYNNFAMSHFDVNDFQEQSIHEVVKPELELSQSAGTHLTLFTLVWTELFMNFILSQSSNATLFYFDNIFGQANALRRLVQLGIETYFSFLAICLKPFKTKKGG